MFSYFSKETMRLNEKNVAAFAAAPTPIDKEGWLQKKGEINKGYQRRWFALKGNLLFYFEKQEDREPVGVIVLEKCSVGLCDDGDPYSFYIAFEGQGARTYVLVADNEVDMKSWIKAISHAGYDYLRMMVDELKRRVDRLQAERNRTADPFEAAQAAAEKGGGAKSTVVRYSTPVLTDRDTSGAGVPRYHTVALGERSGSSMFYTDSSALLQPVSAQNTSASATANHAPAQTAASTRTTTERKNPFGISRSQPSFVSHTQPTTATTAGLELTRLSNGPDILGKKPVRSFVEMHTEFGAPIRQILDKQEGVNRFSSSFTSRPDNPVARQPMNPVL
jgi:hypothetical protein